MEVAFLCLYIVSLGASSIVHLFFCGSGGISLFDRLRFMHNMDAMYGGSFDDVVRCFKLDYSLFDDLEPSAGDVRQQCADKQASLLQNTGFKEFALKFIEHFPHHQEVKVWVYAASFERAQAITDQFNRGEVRLVECRMPDYN